MTELIGQSFSEFRAWHKSPENFFLKLLFLEASSKYSVHSNRK